MDVVAYIDCLLTLVAYIVPFVLAVLSDPGPPHIKLGRSGPV